MQVANDYKRGQQLMSSKEYHHHAPLFQRIFEVRFEIRAEISKFMSGFEMLLF